MTNDEIDLRILRDRFTEVVAKSLDIYDQRYEEKYPPFDHERGLRRYLGTPKDEMPPYTLEINNFRPVVDSIVFQLINALDDENWKRSNEIVPGLKPNHTTK